MSENKHGSMDISYHEKVFAGFVKFSFWVCIFSFAVLVFLALFNS